jgi:hypothetical protein
MSNIDLFAIAAVVLVLGGLAAVLLEMAVKSPRSFREILTDVRGFAERPPEQRNIAEQPQAEQPASKADSDDPRMAA